jgi:hypothetical protein
MQNHYLYRRGENQQLHYPKLSRYLPYHLGNRCTIAKNDICTFATYNDVIIFATKKDIISIVPVNKIIASVPVKDIVTFTAVEVVVAFFPIENVRIWTAVKSIISRSAKLNFTATIAVDNIVNLIWLVEIGLGNSMANAIAFSGRWRRRSRFRRRRSRCSRWSRSCGWRRSRCSRWRR